MYTYYIVVSEKKKKVLNVDLLGAEMQTFGAISQIDLLMNICELYWKPPVAQ